MKCCFCDDPDVVALYHRLGDDRPLCWAHLVTCQTFNRWNGRAPNDSITVIQPALFGS